MILSRIVIGDNDMDLLLYFTLLFETTQIISRMSALLQRATVIRMEVTRIIVELDTNVMPHSIIAFDEQLFH